MVAPAFASHDLGYYGGYYDYGYSSYSDPYYGGYYDAGYSYYDPYYYGGYYDAGYYDPYSYGGYGSYGSYDYYGGCSSCGYSYPYYPSVSVSAYPVYQQPVVQPIVQPVSQPIIYTQPPVVTVNPSTSFSIVSGQPSAYTYHRIVNLGQTLQFNLLASGNAPFSYSALYIPIGATFNSGTGSFSWTPTAAGNQTAIFRVFDSRGNYSTVQVGIEVRNVPPALFTSGPVTTPTAIIGTAQVPIQFISFNPPTTAREGQLYTYTVQAVSGAGRMAYRIVNGPQGLTIHRDFGIILWLPNFTQGGASYSVTVGAHNGFTEAFRTFNITVEDVSQAVVRSAPAPAPAAPVYVASVDKQLKIDKQPEEKEKRPEPNYLALAMADFLGALGGVFLNPWFLLLVVLILLLVIWRMRRRYLEEKQLTAMEAAYRKGQQTSPVTLETGS